MDVYPEWFYLHVKVHYDQSCYLTHFSFLLSSFENEFKSSRKSEEYLYAGSPALDPVAFLNKGSRLCCSGAGTLSSVSLTVWPDSTSLGAVWWPSLTGAECLETGTGSPCAGGGGGGGGGKCYRGGLVWSESWQVGPGSKNVTELVCLNKNLKECCESISFLGIC